ncbi:MAG TPA: hypothetical protein VNQ99_02390 [Xanthobacteraceae bacterium]|nr:hypothetical protein [Xanthobacteraceae bacterium]
MPFLLPTLGKIALGVAGAAAMTVMAVREFRRLAAEQAQMKQAQMKPVRVNDLPTLRRDPETGEYRPM